MIQDKAHILSSAQNVTASAASSVAPYIGADNIIAKPMRLVILCKTTADSAHDDATVTFEVQTSSASSFGTKAVLAKSSTFAIGSAALTAGNKAFEVELGKDLLGYVRVYYTVASAGGDPADTELSAGKFDAFITDATETRYPVS